MDSVAKRKLRSIVQVDFRIFMEDSVSGEFRNKKALLFEGRAFSEINL